MEIHFNTKKKESLIHEATNFSKILSNVLKTYETLNIGKLSVDVLSEMEEPGNHIREKIFFSSKEMQALPIERSHALSMIKMPETTPQFVEAFQAYKRALYSPNSQPILDYSFYDIKGTEVTVNDTFHSYVKNVCSVSTKTKEQEEVYTITKQMFQQLEELKKKNPKLALIPQGTTSNILYTGLDNKLYFNPLSILNN